MNPCHIYWNDISRTNNIDITNEEEINFVRDCITKWYKQLLNLIKQNIPTRLHKDLTIDYYNIINNYRGENITEQIHIITSSKKYNLPLVVNSRINHILEIMRNKVKEHESFVNAKNSEKKSIKKDKETLKKYRKNIWKYLIQFLENLWKKKLLI